LSLAEIREMDGESFDMYLEELNDLIRQENKAD